MLYLFSSSFYELCVFFLLHFYIFIFLSLYLLQWHNLCFIINNLMIIIIMLLFYFQERFLICIHLTALYIRDTSHLQNHHLCRKDFQNLNLVPLKSDMCSRVNPVLFLPISFTDT